MSKIARAMKRAHKELGNWRAVGVAYGINGAMAFRIAERGYEPTRPDIRHRLGLPAMVPVSCCPKCGGVHLKSRCDAGKIRRCDPEFVTGGMIE